MPKGKDKLAALDTRNQLPREPKRALELIDRFLIGAYQRADDTWPVFDLSDFIESNLFLQAAAE